MTHIHLTTFIAAPIERVFDLSRSIDLHKISTSSTREEAIAGKTSGLININETVTWKARHLFKTRQFTSAIPEMELPLYFKDEMIKGDFKSFAHKHHFKKIDNGTIMIDMIEFESPYGALGRFVNRVFFKNYVEKLLLKRNAVIKNFAETQKWKDILNKY
jgi:ligand-binding SRPBCC domain-containing protein